jgi:hypothetical protein
MLIQSTSKVTRMTAQAIIPLSYDQEPADKRLNLQSGHWLEVTCPQCSDIRRVGNLSDGAFFHYGLTRSSFYCHECHYEVAEAFILKGFTYIDELPHMIIEKSSAFRDVNVIYCRDVREEVNSLQ